LKTSFILLLRADLLRADTALDRTAGDRVNGLMDSGAPGIGAIDKTFLRHCPQPIALHETPLIGVFWF
jgi:hypothetical protein